MSREVLERSAQARHRRLAERPYNRTRAPASTIGAGVRYAFALARAVSAALSPCGRMSRTNLQSAITLIPAMGRRLERLLRLETLSA